MSKRQVDVATQPGAVRFFRREIIKDHAGVSWHGMVEVTNYRLGMNAVTQPMMVREGLPDFGTHRRAAEDAEGGSQ